MTCYCFFFTPKLTFLVGTAFLCSSCDTIFLRVGRMFFLPPWFPGFSNSGPGSGLVDMVSTAGSCSHRGPGTAVARSSI